MRVKGPQVNYAQEITMIDAILRLIVITVDTALPPTHETWYEYGVRREGQRRVPLRRS